MKRRLIFGSLVAGLSLNLFVGTALYLQAADREDPYQQMKVFTTVLERVRQDYVDEGKVKYEDLVRGALRGMIETLDPHSEYMEPPKFDALKEDTEGQFGGVGLTIQLREGFVTVAEPMDESPGALAGILAGDRIMKIDGRSLEKANLSEAVKRLRGEPGTDVLVTMYRPSTGETKEHKLTRAEIKVPTARDTNNKREFPLGENKIGYIRLIQFGERTANELEDGLQKLEKQGMESLILDLRNNPGGLLDQAVNVCEKFLPRGTLVVSTEGRNAAQKAEYRASGVRQHPKFNIVVLVNGNSASAAEIVSGCLQDLKRAVIVGEQTFGKGSVQSILPLQDGSALRLTTAKYYTPSHKVIHERGIKPDIAVELNDQQEIDLAIKRSPGAIENLPAADRERVLNARDLQLERAVDLLKGLQFFTRPVHDDAKPEKVAAR